MPKLPVHGGLPGPRGCACNQRKQSYTRGGHRTAVRPPSFERFGAHISPSGLGWGMHAVGEHNSITVSLCLGTMASHKKDFFVGESFPNTERDWLNHNNELA